MELQVSSFRFFKAPRKREHSHSVLFACRDEFRDEEGGCFVFTAKVNVTRIETRLVNVLHTDFNDGHASAARAVAYQLS